MKEPGENGSRAIPPNLLGKSDNFRATWLTPLRASGSPGDRNDNPPQMDSLEEEEEDNGLLNLPIDRGPSLEEMIEDPPSRRSSEDEQSFSDEDSELEELDPDLVDRILKGPYTRDEFRREFDEENNYDHSSTQSPINDNSSPLDLDVPLPTPPPAPIFDAQVCNEPLQIDFQRPRNNHEPIANLPSSTIDPYGEMGPILEPTFSIKKEPPFESRFMIPQQKDPPSIQMEERKVLLIDPRAQGHESIDEKPCLLNPQSEAQRISRKRGRPRKSTVDPNLPPEVQEKLLVHETQKRSRLSIEGMRTERREMSVFAVEVLKEDFIFHDTDLGDEYELLRLNCSQAVLAAPNCSEKRMFGYSGWEELERIWNTGPWKRTCVPKNKKTDEPLSKNAQCQAKSNQLLNLEDAFYILVLIPQSLIVIPKLMSAFKEMVEFHKELEELLEMIDKLVDRWRSHVTQKTPKDRLGLLERFFDCQSYVYIPP